MSAKAIYDNAPLGALIRFSDGRPRPPARFTRKLAAWERSNGVGRLIRKSPPFGTGRLASPATITLHEGDISSANVVLVIVHRTHGVDSALQFEVIDVPKPDSWRIVRPCGEAVELLHLADDRAAADAWLRQNRHPGARIELVDDLGDASADADASGSPAQEAV
ncbi:hypothetical protein V5F77_24905 [Xanthobacter sp. DSM 24535]|uniref:hypothetical protein n=1 Tax=Roseixanthobacter psychrophilus TaxID=3119917 RepID=UPI00372CB1F6